MPKLTQLPDGRWVYVPDIDPYIEQLRSRSPPVAEPSWGFEEEEDKGTLAGSAWEGFKSIPSGVADIFLSGAQAAIGVVTPFADLPVEKRLRRQASKRARERDPAYRDAFLPAVGTGLGQVAGLSVLSRLPGGWYAAMGAGIGMGISEQTRRIADYEQRTGINVPWYKESAAHMMGALIGLSEVVPIKFGMFPASVSKMMGRMKAGLDPSSFRHISKLEQRFGLRKALGMGLMEGTQEASTQWLQALSARGLYDPNAMEDIARSMAEDFKVGGVVGGIAKLVQHQILGKKFRNADLLHSLNTPLMQSMYRQDERIRDVHGSITGIAEELPETLRKLGVEKGIARSITNMFGGTWSSIPFGLDESLKSGLLMRSQVEAIVDEFQRRNEGALYQLNQVIGYYSRAGNNAEVKKYTTAKAALNEMAAERLGKLRRTVGELGGGLGEMGGLTGNEQYQKARQAAIKVDGDNNVEDVQLERRGARERGDQPPSYRPQIRSLMGGVFNALGFYEMAEALGTHRGPGSEQVRVGVDMDLATSDLELASSDRANFNIVELGGILLAHRGKHESSTYQQPVDKSDVMDGLIFRESIERAGGVQQRNTRQTLSRLDKDLEKLEQSNDDLYKSPVYAFTREFSEIFGEMEYADDADWIRHRDESQEVVFRQSQRNNAEISRIKREQSIIYSQTLAQRLREAESYFSNFSGDKQKAVERVFGKPANKVARRAQMKTFDYWLDGTIKAVEQSELNGLKNSRLADAKRQEFQVKMAALDVDASEAEKAAAEAQFNSENVRSLLEFPRDISASQFMRIADLFIDDPKDTRVQDKIEGALILRAYGNISNWKVQDILYDVSIDGIPTSKETREVVEKFENKLLKVVTDTDGKVSIKDGKNVKQLLPEHVSVDDIVELLKSKNIYLRDEKRIGSKLAKDTGVGVESRPFEKLLLDMTGALSWNNVFKDGKISVKGATFAQRLLMYSRLLQLPGHYGSRSSPQEQDYLEEMGKEDYRPLFLPDFYHDPSIDGHIDFMTDEVVEVTEEGDREFPSFSISGLKAKTRKALGNEFNSESFDEGLARLIETGVFNPDPYSDIDLDVDAEYLRAEREGLGKKALAGPRVRFNVNYEPTAFAWPGAGEETFGAVGPGDTKAQKVWVRESDPELVRKHLADEDAPWASQVDDLWASYNAKSPGKPLTKEQFIKEHAALITSDVAPLQELSDLGILDTIQGTVIMPGRTAPTESVLQLGTVGGKSLIRALMKTGALPSSLQDNVHALRRRFVDTMKTRFETLGKNLEKLFKTLRLSDNIQLQYVDDADGLFQFLEDVAIRGEDMSADLPAMYDRPGNRIIINLAAVDPNNMVSAQRVVKDAAFHEGLHALIIRDHLTDEELNVLYNYVRNEENIVPEEIDKAAHDAGLTWFERSVIETVDTDLAEGDIEKEAVISLLENLVRHPDVYVEGKKTRKIRKDIRGFLEGFVEAAKDADIVDVLRILGRIESGEVGERGAGYLGDKEYTADSIIRSNDLLRYANPRDIEQLRAAVILRDAAPSAQMRESEQAKVDDIADRIIANRGIIQESAPPPPDAVQAMEDARQKIQHMRDTHAGSVPVIGPDSKKDPEAYKLALNTFMEMRGKDPRYAYKMPAPYQTFFDNRPKTPPAILKLVRGAIKSGAMAPIDKDATRKSFDDGGALSPDGLSVTPTGDTIEATEDNAGKTASKLRYLYLDRRQWIVEQTDRLLAAQNRAQLDAETSALVMWRNSDNALNWLPGLMLRGPLSFLGTSVGAGRFENAPVYDNDLQEKFGGDGRVQGLNEIFAPIIDSQDQETASLYGMAKRISWTKKRRDSFRSITAGIAEGDLDPATKLKWKKFEEAYEAINLGNKFTEDQLNEIIREVETNEGSKFIIEFWDRYNAYDNHMIKMSYNTGMITREVRDEWLSMPWAPFYRDVMIEEDFPISSRQEAAKRGVNLVEKALRGSMEPISSKLAEGVITNTQALVRDAMMNVAVSRTVRDAVALGDAKKIDISNMAASLNNRVVRVMEEGIPVFYELKDAQLAMSVMMLGFNPKKQLQEFFGEHTLGKGIQKALTGASTVLRESVTRTLPFAIKNIFRDSWNAMILTGGGPPLVLEAFRNAFTVDSLRRADEAGLSIGIDFIADRGEYGAKMRSELNKANLDWKNPLTPFAAAWNFTGRISKQSEVATRLAVYDRVLAMTGDKALAQYYAIEIMNYGRRGASPTLSTYMATVPFMNGRLQGLDVTYRGLRSKKGSSDIPGVYGYGLTVDEYEGLPMWKKSRGMVLGRGLLLTAATTVLYLLMRDDDEWQDLRDEVKADNWVLPLSDHAWLKIPIPFEIGVLFKVIPEKLLEAIMEKDVSAADVGEEFIRQMKTSLSIGGPQLFTPVVNAMRNYDTFRKDAIVDHWMEETLSANEQRNRYTSNVARGVADLVNSIPLVKNLDFLTSPMKVEYMMRQYVGTTGGYVITMADRLARTGWLLDLPFDPYMNLAEAESVVGTTKDFDWKSLIGGEGIANVPILGDLLTDPRTRGGRQQAFYEMIEELDTIIATLNSITDRDLKKGFEYRQKHLDVLRHRHQLRSIQNQMKKWRERRDHLAKIPSTSMSNDEKREYNQRLLESRQSILTGVRTLMASMKQ